MNREKIACGTLTRRGEPTTPDPALKGKLNGNCNREDCQKPGAVFYNKFTRAHYCANCAERINEANPEPICTEVEITTYEVWLDDQRGATYGSIEDVIAEFAAEMHELKDADPEQIVNFRVVTGAMTRTALDNLPEFTGY